MKADLDGDIYMYILKHFEIIFSRFCGLSVVRRLKPMDHWKMKQHKEVSEVKLEILQESAAEVA